MVGFSIATYNVRDFLGPGDGVGEVFHRARLRVLAESLEQIDADVVAFQEVGSAELVDAACALLPSRAGVPSGGYAPAWATAPDRRGIACALISRVPLRSVTEHRPELLPMPVFVEGDPVPFAGRLGGRRGVLEATVDAGIGADVHVLVVHLKSKLPRALARGDGTSARMDSMAERIDGQVRSLVYRTAEALAIRRRVDERLDANPNAGVIVLGDFNDGAESVPVRVVSGDMRADLMARQEEARTGVASRVARRALVNCADGLPTERAYTISFAGRREVVDHVLASPSLARRVVGVRVFNDDLETMVAQIEAAGDAPSVFSDHAALRVQFG